MYIWRFPIEAFAVLLTTGVLLIATALLFALRARSRHAFVRALATTTVFLLLALSPLAVDRMVLWLNTASGITRMYIDPDPPVAFGPAVVTVILLIVAHFAFPSNLPRVKYCAGAFLFLTANLANTCAPGWCATYGFPIRFYWRSDEIITFNGRTPSPFHPVALAVDLAVFVFGTYVVARAYRRVISSTSVLSRRRRHEADGQCTLHDR